MDCSLLLQVKAAFDSLWRCEPIDANTIRITTPYASINNLYIDLYIKKQGKKLIVTDGGFLQKNLTSGELGVPDSKVFKSIIDTYIAGYEIKLKVNDESILYYKETEKEKMLSNCVFEMADFARTYLSAITIGTERAQEPDLQKERFESDAKKFLREKYTQKDQVQFDQQIGYEGRKKKVSAVIYSSQKLNPVQFLSGTFLYYYKSNINNAHQDYALLKDFPMMGLKLALYDDTSEIYREQSPILHEYLSSMTEVLSHEPIPWSQREKIQKLVTAA